MKKGFALLLLASVLLACKTFTPLTPTPPQPTAVPESAILAEVLKDFEECRSATGVETGDNTYSFSCSNSADTGYSVSMTRLASEAAARTAFEAGHSANAVVCFHGYDLYEASSPNPYNQFVKQEQLQWQAGQWVVSIHASYDYGYFHFTARGFAEAVYASSVEHDLFPAGTCPNQ